MGTNRIRKGVFGIEHTGMDYRALILLFAAGLLLWPSQGWSTIYNVPLGVNAIYDCGEEIDFDIDLGEELLAVNSVKIDWYGYIQAGKDCYGNVYSTSFTAYLDAESSYQRAVGPVVGVSTFPNVEYFDCETLFSPYPAGTTWDFLLDGTASGWVELTGFAYAPEFPPQFEPGGVLFSASLIIDATPVPEPGALGLLAIGGLALRRRLKK